MKFARYIETLQRDCPTEWRGKFIRYKELKKALKRAAGGRDDERVDPAKEDDFFHLLERQMVSINKHFQGTAGAVISAYRASQRRPTLCCFLRPRGLSREREAALAQQAYWCRKFAKANAVALRKILKKHDKICGNMRGRTYLQHCWRSNSVGLFLHSPLVDELKAVEDQLEARQARAQQDRELCEQPPAAKAPAEQAPGAGAVPAVLGGGMQAAAPGAAGAAGALAAEAEAEAPCASAGRRPGSLTPGVVPLEQSASAGQEAEGAPPRAALARAAAGGPPSAPRDIHPVWGGGALVSPTTGADSQCSPHGSGSVVLQQLHSGLSSSPCSSMDGGGSSLATSAGLPVPCFPTSRRQQEAQHGLAAIIESPTCMLDSSDIEWEARGLDQHPPSRAASPVGSLPPAEGSAGGAPLPQSPSFSRRFSDDDLRCPICLDILFRPVGLGCGHKFCQPCALEHAHMQSVVGTFRGICSNILPSRNTCPQCRQPGVFDRAVQLKQLGELIEERFPEEWEEREEEAARAKDALVQQMHRQTRARQVASAYELLF